MIIIIVVIKITIIIKIIINKIPLTCKCFLSALSASLSPPRSAMFSPCVNLPFRCTPYISNCSACFIITAALFSYSIPSLPTHQSLILPSESYFLP